MTQFCHKYFTYIRFLGVAKTRRIQTTTPPIKNALRRHSVRENGIKKALYCFSTELFLYIQHFQRLSMQFVAVAFI